MAKIQAVWAIDIGQSALKALKLSPGEEPEQLVAEAFDYVEYPKILSQPDADAEELVREALSTFLERNDVKGCRVAVGVSGQAGLVKFIKLPPVEKKRIPDIVKFEARQQIPFALEEVIWDYQQIGGDSSEEEDEGFTMAEVGLFAMKRDQINRAILPLKNAGIEVDIVQMGPIALYNYIAFDNPPPKPEEKGETPGSYVLLDIGADNTDLIITDGTRIWQRNVPIGGNHFTRGLTKELKLTFAKAEHLKRNATKAPDPRAVFTAMRGVFNDFSSEVQRSIGFYSSVNRQAKILKVIGLGNGFKLPGLQKFLQQNLNQEIEKLERFQRLVGDEVINAPQFQENLPSFAVAYGLAVQGLDRAPLKTNLLPPEIEQTRMIRRKKPWALAASTLLMLGFSAMFLSAWHALAKTRPFEDPVKQAQAVSNQGKEYQSSYDNAVAEFKKIDEEGKALVADTPDTASWPALLQTLLAALPNPAREFKLRDPNFDPNLPANVGIVGMLRVHVDKIVPVWREDLKADWYDKLDQSAKDSMHAYDREKPPEGAGWVIQVVGHHYNPSPLAKLGLSDREKQFAKGPMPYLQYIVLPRLWSVPLRLFGIHHAALTWFHPDREWTSEKGVSAVPPPPLLARAKPKVEAAEGGMPGAEGMMGMMGQMGRMAGMDSVGEGMPGMGGYGMPGMAGMPGMGGMAGMPGMGGMAGYGMGGYGPGTAKKKDDVKTLTRTDFKIELVWQSPKPEDQPKTAEEMQAKRDELEKALDEAVKKAGKGAIKQLDEAALAKASVEKSAQAVKEAIKEVQAEAGLGKTPATAPAPAGQPAAAPPAGATPPPSDEAKPQ